MNPRLLLPLLFLAALILAPARLHAAPAAAASSPAKASVSTSSTPNEILAEAQKLIKENNCALAKQLLDPLIKRPNLDRPVLAEAVFLRGRVAQKTEQYTDAVIWYQRYIAEFPDQIDAPYVTFLLGQTYENLGAYDRARETFYETLNFAIKKASSLQLEDFSNSVRLTQAAAWELAETEYLAGNWERADELYERFKNQNPALDNLVQTACYRQADISFQLKHTKEAIARYESALAAAPFHPFATEAWFRLITLYGMTGDTNKQVAATQSFIWMVNSLEKSDQLYWQRRLADQLLTEYRGHLQDQIPLLDTIMKFQNNDSWMRMLDFYLSLLARQTDQPNDDIPLPSTASGDTWNEWLKGFRAHLSTIVEKMEVMRDTDSSLKDAPPKATK